MIFDASRLNPIAGKITRTPASAAKMKPADGRRSQKSDDAAAVNVAAIADALTKILAREYILVEIASCMSLRRRSSTSATSSVLSKYSTPSSISNLISGMEANLARASVTAMKFDVAEIGVNGTNATDVSTAAPVTPQHLATFVLPDGPAAPHHGRVSARASGLRFLRGWRGGPWRRGVRSTFAVWR